MAEGLAEAFYQGEEEHNNDNIEDQSTLNYYILEVNEFEGQPK